MQPHAVGLGMQMQLVTREAAELLLEKTLYFTVLSIPICKCHGSTVLAGFYPFLLRGWVKCPEILGGSLIGQKQRFREKIHREVMRPIYR